MCEKIQGGDRGCAAGSGSVLSTGYTDNATASRMRGKWAYVGHGSAIGSLPTPGQDGQAKEDPRHAAERLLKADAEHRSLAADQALMLRMVMPFVGQGLNQLAEGCYRWFAHQGFWPNWVTPCYHNTGGVPEVNDAIVAGKIKKAEKIALIHSEVSEMLEAVRKDDHRNEAEEAADILVRLLDYCGACGIDLGLAFEQKMLANYERPYKHGKGF